MIDFIRRKGHASRDEIKSRFALTDRTVNELMDGLAEMGHVKRAWVLGDLYEYGR